MPETAQELGLHFIIGLQGTELSAAEERLLARIRPAGIILFAKNIDRGSQSWTESLHALVRRARELAARETFLVSVDHEGGRVMRFPEPVTRFPAARSWSDRAGEVAAAMAKELAALSCNLSFAPVLDVHSEESNPVIGVRALSSDPAETGRLGAIFVHALEAGGVLACGKHFPGHGATTSDSHFVLPRLEVAEAVFRSRELVPFQRLIDEGIGLIMTAHVLYPVFDPALPATLSPRIIRGLLRAESAFSGAVITDDLEMKALDQYNPARKAVLALQAGNDILLEANPEKRAALEVAEEMYVAIERGLEGGTLDPDDLLLSQSRVSRLLERAKRLSAASAPLSGRYEQLGNAAHVRLAGELAGPGTVTG